MDIEKDAIIRRFVWAKGKAMQIHRMESRRRKRQVDTGKICKRKERNVDIGKGT